MLARQTHHRFFLRAAALPTVNSEPSCCVLARSCRVAKNICCSSSSRTFTSSSARQDDRGTMAQQPGPSAMHRAPSSSNTASKGQSDETTHFGFRSIPSSSKESLVGSVFSSVASSYDVMNDAMSLGIHRLWKDHFVSTILDPRGGISVLDVAGGTGDIALRILDHARDKYGDRDLTVNVLDINEHMLRNGMRRARKGMYWGTKQLRFSLGNAEALHVPLTPTLHSTAHSSNGDKSRPLTATTGASLLPSVESAAIADNSVDLYTIAFGIRNCTHIDQVLAEAHRVLKPGGVFACLEFGKVGFPLLAELYRSYSFTFIPSMGQLLAGDRDSYQYLIESIERFPTQPTFARMMRSAGFALAGSPEAKALGWDALPDTLTSGRGAGSSSAGGQGPGAWLQSLGEAGLGVASHLPGIGEVVQRQKHAVEEQRMLNADVAGAWQDLSLGIASIWVGVKPAPVPAPASGQTQAEQGATEGPGSSA